MDGHNLDSINTVQGEIVWDRYIPAKAHTRFKGYYNYTVRNNIYMNGNIKAEYPSFISPSYTFMRTGIQRDIHRSTDTGHKQLKRWGFTDITPEEDIKRGNFSRPDDYFKKLVYSIDWERSIPTYKDQNYYKRSIKDGGFGDMNEERTEDNYFDIQFIGAPFTYPKTYAVGNNFTWAINWVPWLCKKYPRKNGQPLKSEPFNLGGVEPLQVWFYPDGSMISELGYCSMKLVSVGGWDLPYKINISVYSEFGGFQYGPFYRNTKPYILHTRNLCRLFPKNMYLEKEKDMYLGPAGNIYISISIGEENYDWDDGTHDFEQWLKKQSADPDSQYLADVLSPRFTHSEYYENFKYKSVPDKHFSKYLIAQKYYGNNSRYEWQRCVF